MIAGFLKKLMQPAGPLPDTDARLALAALLVRVARSDSDYATVETDRIDRILAVRYELEPGEATLLREEAEAVESEAPDTVRFTRAIKDAVPHEHRLTVIESLWQVALADGVRDEHEDAQLRLIANLLGINDRDCALARQRVERRM